VQHQPHPTVLRLCSQTIHPGNFAPDAAVCK
jgi:hypothetical protein